MRTLYDERALARAVDELFNNDPHTDRNATRFALARPCQLRFSPDARLIARRRRLRRQDLRRQIEHHVNLAEANLVVVPKKPALNPLTVHVGSVSAIQILEEITLGRLANPRVRPRHARVGNLDRVARLAAE